MVLPKMLAKGLFGRRVEARRTGIIVRNFLVIEEILFLEFYFRKLRKADTAN